MERYFMGLNGFHTWLYTYLICTSVSQAKNIAALSTVTKLIYSLSVTVVTTNHENCHLVVYEKIFYVDEWVSSTAFYTQEMFFPFFHQLK